jgi:hypothetical protein
VNAGCASVEHRVGLPPADLLDRALVHTDPTDVSSIGCFKANLTALEVQVAPPEAEDFDPAPADQEAEPGNVRHSHWEGGD